MLFWYIKDAENASSHKVLAAAALCQVPMETFPVDETDESIPASREFREDYDPSGRFPVLETTRVVLPTAGAAEGGDAGTPTSGGARASGTAEELAARVSHELEENFVAQPATGDVLSAYGNLRKDVEEFTNIFGTNAILRYVGRQMTSRVEDDAGAAAAKPAASMFYPKHVYGRTPFEAALIDSWIDYSQNQIDAANRPYAEAMHNARRKARAAVREASAARAGSTSARRSTASGSAGGSGAVSASAVAAALKNVAVDPVSDAECLPAVERALGGLDLTLSIRTYLVGERLSLADVAVAFSVHEVYRANRRHGDALAKRFQHVYRHYNTVMRHPAVREVLRNEGATIGPLRP